jgi:hypothetical protein
MDNDLCRFHNFRITYFTYCQHAVTELGYYIMQFITACWTQLPFVIVMRNITQNSSLMTHIYRHLLWNIFIEGNFLENACMCNI